MHILDLANNTVTTLPDSNGIFWPRWSPNGRFIMGSERETLYVKLFDLKLQRWTTLVRGWAIWPTWSRDSRFVYSPLWLGEAGRPGGQYRIPVAGGKPEFIGTGFATGGWYQCWYGLDPNDNPLMMLDRSTNEIYALTLERK